MDTCRDIPLDEDDAWPLEKQQITRERRILQRDKWMSVSDCECERLNSGIVDVCFKQGSNTVGVVAEIGGHVDPEIIILGDEIKSAAPQVHPWGG